MSAGARRHKTALKEWQHVARRWHKRQGMSARKIAKRLGKTVEEVRMALQ